LAALGYIEFGYTLLMRVLAVFKTPITPLPDNRTPTVTLLIAAHNEEQVIGSRLENALALDYPQGKLQILVVSDGSSDRTNEIVASYADRGVALCAHVQRRGKVPALRDAEPLIQNEIVVFSDADSQYQPDAVQKLVRHFSDPSVGAVSGHEKRLPSSESGNGRGEGLYARYDNYLKALEGVVGSQVMVNGGIFAIRKSLLPFVPDHLTHDGIVPPSLVLTGHRVAYEPEAVSVETYALDSSQDLTRRIRTVQQAFQSYLSLPKALNPRMTGLFAVQVWSHRILRWFVFPLMLVLLASNLLLALRSRFFRITVIMQGLFWAMALAGRILDRRGRRPAACYIPFYFLYIHYAAWIAVWRSLTGGKVAIWNPTIREAAPESENSA
jgi:cellulose synthase/poly-beta-1,6-N-acetylglucosamine synthase-like glycosyltransferase